MEQLPPELLELVFTNLEREDQKTYRCLSKLHYDLATKALFTRVNVYFGLWAVYSRISQSNETIAELRRKNNATWEILQHISLCPGFAKVVKELDVWAYLPVAGKGLGEDIFHVRTLIAALQALPALHAFRWHGISPALGQDVLAALVQSSGPSLTQLHIPFTGTTVRCLSAFSGLQELRGSLDGEFYIHSSPGDEHARALQMALDSMSHTLRRLAVVGGVLWGWSGIQSMRSLQELEVVPLSGIPDGLGLVFRHCLALRSLTVFTRMEDESLSALQENATALPDLRALKFIYWSEREVFGPQHSQILARFVENKRELISLDVEIRAHGHETCERPLLEAIAALPHLEVLGFTLVRTAWATGDIQFFRDHLPQRLTALRVSVFLNEVDNGVFPEEWLSLIKDLTSLRYLHIFDSLRTSGLGQRVLEDPPPSLELFGCGPFLRWIMRDPDPDLNDMSNAKIKHSPCWPPFKVKFRSMEDFRGCGEWEWLLRWYDDNLTPGMFDWSALYRAALLE